MRKLLTGIAMLALAAPLGACKEKAPEADANIEAEMNAPAVAEPAPATDANTADDAAAMNNVTEQGSTDHGSTDH
jgi:hypothetical protein